MLKIQINTQVMSAFHFTRSKECMYSAPKIFLHNEDMGGFMFCILTKSFLCFCVTITALNFYVFQLNF